MNSLTLSACLRLADDVASDARQIGRTWPGYSAILATCKEFRRACETIADRRGLPSTTIAFVGPKNAGKTHCLSLLVRNEERRAQLRIGADPEHATKHPVWLAADRPSGIESAGEQYIPCASEDLEPLGVPYALLDVPGLNEGQAGRRKTALHALDEARLKVLVIEHRGLSLFSWKEYLERTDGATILPIVTMARNLTEAELHDFDKELRASVPHSRRVLQTIVMSDFNLEGASREDIVTATRKTLVDRLSEVVGEIGMQLSEESELIVRQDRFRSEIAALARRHLHATSQALEPILQKLEELPIQAAEALLGCDYFPFRGRDRHTAEALFFG